eukprot:jgi/Chrzof1/8861/Cz03g27040.t1
MRLFLAFGMFEKKNLPQTRLTLLAASYVGYIVLCNLSLNINTVGFYQVMKIAVAPTVLVIEAIYFHKIPQQRVVASVLLVCIGVAVATVTDSKIVTHLPGVFVGLAATLVTALYQIWAGTKQKELKASSMQLLHQYTPQATVMLGLLVPIMEPVGFTGGSNTILGYHYTAAAVAAILVSAVLGLLVSLSTFLVIGATSSLTYNVVGHLKTVIILTGGCIWFNDEMPLKKFVGVCIAMAGIVWYTHLKLQPSPASAPASAHVTSKPVLPVVLEDANDGSEGSEQYAATYTNKSLLPAQQSGISNGYKRSASPGSSHHV